MTQETEKKRLPVLPGIIHEPTSLGDRAYLIGGKCKSCGRVFFPKIAVCRVCMVDATIEEIALSARGKIDTFAVVHVAPMGFKAPYIQSYVDLPEGPRIFALITGIDPMHNDLKEGAEVELVIDKIREDEKGNDLIGYMFQPVGK
jgi:uncharacterized OB-fold protein